MIKRTLYFGNSVYLGVKTDQLIISFPEKEKDNITIPIEDIGVVILDHYGITVSQFLVDRLIKNNVALITCNEKHMPTGLMLNLAGHTLQQEHFQNQISASEPLKKRLWKQTIKEKITNQGVLLDSLNINNDNMRHWAGKVRSGDPDNYEARAAVYYWKNLFVEYTDNFKRGRFEEEPNNLLNYGYAVLRAITARSLVGSGLLPTLGIHHHNKYNAYCLADDIMEPYRPFVDNIVVEILMDGEDDIYDLSPSLKQKLLQIPVIDVIMGKKRKPLMIAMQQTTASLAKCFSGEKKKIKYPSLCLSID